MLLIIQSCMMPVTIYLLHGTIVTCFINDENHILI